MNSLPGLKCKKKLVQKLKNKLKKTGRCVNTKVGLVNHFSDLLIIFQGSQRKIVLEHH